MEEACRGYRQYGKRSTPFSQSTLCLSPFPAIFHANLPNIVPSSPPPPSSSLLFSIRIETGNKFKSKSEDSKSVFLTIPGCHPTNDNKIERGKGRRGDRCRPPSLPPSPYQQERGEGTTPSPSSHIHPPPISLFSSPPPPPHFPPLLPVHSTQSIQIPPNNINSPHPSPIATMPMANGTMHHKMWMFFHTQTNDTILFSFWTVQTAIAMLFSCLALFLAAFLFELLKWFRLVMEQRGNSQSGSGGGRLGGSQSANRRYADSLLSSAHLLQTGLFSAQLLLSYLLMLAVMTFSLWVMVAICAGAAAGFWLFGRRQPVLASTNGRPNPEIH